MSGQFVVERSEVISASPEKLFSHVGNLESMNEWSPWVEMDPNMETTYTGASGAAGSTYSWSGNRKVGQGNMTITEVEANKRVAIDLNFLKPFKSQNVTEVMLDSDGTGTKVTWRMTGPKTFMVKVMGLFGKSMDKMVGPDFEKGLAKLKAIAEA